MPPHHGDRCEHDAEDHCTSRRRRQPEGRGGGRAHDAEHEKRSDDLHRYRHRQPEHEHEQRRQRPDRHSTRGGHVGVETGEHQRTPHHRHGHENDDGDPEQPAERGRVDRHDLPGQQAELVRRPPLVERQEQHAEAGPERHQHADDRVPVAGPDSEKPDQDGRDQ